jgi:hypothetical protein
MTGHKSQNITPEELDIRVRKAIKHFWENRQSKSVRAGETLDEFSSLIRELLINTGIPSTAIFLKQQVELPGFFRPTKKWDLVVVLNGQLFAALELKSQVGSFSNNFNNRTEEAVGSASDLWAAYREGAFKLSPRPWLGYMILLEEAPESIREVETKEPHFNVLEEFRGSSYNLESNRRSKKERAGVSYAKRYELLCKKLVRESLYDAACFLLSDAQNGIYGRYKTPALELSFPSFITPLIGRALAYSMICKDAADTSISE